jgi:tRNA(Ile)-lysidine synthase
VRLDPALAAVRLAVRRELADLPGEAATVLVACSGGADSLALAAATVVEGHRQQRSVIGVTVDHGLQDGSADHASRVVTQLAGIGVDETVAVRVAVEARGQGPEAAAREARYAVLAQVAQRFAGATVLLGHTLDDQAETVLLGLARGSGTRSLSGMRPGFDGFRRPLLELTRAQTEAACRAEGIAWWSDPHNDDERFTRSRVRRVVLPVLERELGPGVAQALARTAAQCRADADALDDLADRALAEARADPGCPQHGLSTERLAPLPDAVLSRVVRSAALEAGALAGDLTLGHVRAVAALARGRAGAQVQLPGHLTAYRDGDLLGFRATAVAG